MKKGDLENTTQLIDLDCVGPNSLSINENIKYVDSINSDKVYLGKASIVMPKLRTYLGKALPNPPKDAIGSSEWFGVNCLIPEHNIEIAAFLNSNIMCEAYRCLQSGKEHPRISVDDLKDLSIDFDLSLINFDEIMFDLEKKNDLNSKIMNYTNVIFGLIRASSAEKEVPLSSLFCKVELNTIKKGQLDEERKLIDLDIVESGKAFLCSFPEYVLEINSDKSELDKAQIVFSKLEAYLGKVLPNPPARSIGTKEWMGLNCLNDINPIVGAYILILPELKTAYRMLQSGKRHARINIDELLELEVPIDYENLEQDKIIMMREKIEIVQEKINLLNNKIKEYRYIELL